MNPQKLLSGVVMLDHGSVVTVKLKKDDQSTIPKASVYDDINC